MSQMKAGSQNGLKQLETSSCPLVLTLPCNLAQTSSNNTIFVSDDDYAEGRNLTRHVHFARYGRYLSRSKGPLFVSGHSKIMDQQHSTICFIVSHHLTILRSSIRASSRRQKVSGSRPGVSSWVRAVRDVGSGGGEDTFIRNQSRAANNVSLGSLLSPFNISSSPYWDYV